jgi:alkanesulfonate monooxygenase SsuD/methylene tetrahydromethanopterin reductase-like flavin-dependent oxidoreductase (luciferase family)
MNVHVVTHLRPADEPPGGTSARVLDYARRVEEKGFPGLWVTDAFARGWASMDPLVALGAFAAVTDRVELGTCVLQVPVRHPVELAHRIETADVLARGRLRLGVGSGSTKADFDVVGADYEGRFRILMRDLEIMGRVWRGEPVDGGRLTPWPGSSGPQVMLGAWRNRRWIEYAATECAGWIASGLYSQWAELERGIKIYRDAGGKRAMLANVIVDLHNRPEVEERARRATVTLACHADEARRRVRQMREVGFDDILCVSPISALEDIERVRDVA